MPDENTDAAAKLKKLGERVRHGWSKKHPMPEQSLETIRQTVRDDWERERTAKRSRTLPAAGKKQKREPPEPEK